MTTKKPSPDTQDIDKKAKEEANAINKKAKEFGGFEGPDPTRYGDWEQNGRCSDF